MQSLGGRAGRSPLPSEGHASRVAAKSVGSHVPRDRGACRCRFRAFPRFPGVHEEDDEPLPCMRGGLRDGCAQGRLRAEWQLRRSRHDVGDERRIQRRERETPFPEMVERRADMNECLSVDDEIAVVELVRQPHFERIRILPVELRDVGGMKPVGEMGLRRAHDRYRDARSFLRNQRQARIVKVRVNDNQRLPRLRTNLFICTNASKNSPSKNTFC